MLTLFIARACRAWTGAARYDRRLARSRAVRWMPTLHMRHRPNGTRLEPELGARPAAAAEQLPGLAWSAPSASTSCASVL
jgi:hypothetical protein